MKKLIGIILAICMLSTMAFAAEITDAAATATGTTVNVTYTALANNAQATMLAYKVADTATADDEKTLAYVDQTTTPIVGIDQEASDGTFEFKLAEGFTGKVVIKVGGADVTTPDTVLLVDFATPVVTPIEILIGDIDGNGKIEAKDGNAVATYARQRAADKKTEVNTNFGASIGTKYTSVDGVTTYIIGDVDGNGKIEAKDGNAIATYARQRAADKKTEVNTNFGASIGSKVQGVK